MSMSKRGEISIFNIVCVLAVILVHSFSGMEQALANQMQRIIFFIPYNVFEFLFEAFLFLSGLRLFLNRYDSMTVDTFYINRFIIVILPYFIFSLIYYAVFWLISETAVSVNDFMMFFLKGEMADDMYFIWVLAQFYVLMPIIARLLKKVNHKAFLIVSLVISVAASCLSGLYPILSRFFPQYMLFFVGGALSAIYYKEFKTLVREKKGIISIIFVLALALYEAVRLLLPAEVSAVVRIVYSCSAITFLFMIATALSDAYHLRNFVLRNIDKSSYFIFLIHGIIIYLVDIVLVEKAGMAPGAEQYAIRALATLTVTVLVSVTWRYIRNILMLKMDR